MRKEDLKRIITGLEEEERADEEGGKRRRAGRLLFCRGEEGAIGRWDALVKMGCSFLFGTVRALIQWRPGLQRPGRVPVHPLKECGRAQQVSSASYLLVRSRLCLNHPLNQPHPHQSDRPTNGRKTRHNKTWSRSEPVQVRYEDTSILQGGALQQCTDGKQAR